MATCLEIIERAHVRAGIRARGDTPSAEETADALLSLQSLYDEMIGLGVFGRLTEVIIEAAYEAGENERIYNTSGGALSVTLPQTVSDEFTGETRPPRDRSVVVIAEDPEEAHIYEAPLGAWKAMKGLAATDYAPLSVRSAEGLACALAARLCEENGRQPGQMMAATAAAFRSQIARRGDSPRVDTYAEYL